MSCSLARWAKTALALMATGALLVALFTGLTLLHGRIDPSLTRANMLASLEILDAEGMYPNIGVVLGHESVKGFAGQGNMIDNYTNAWMIQSADSERYFDDDEYELGKPYDDSARVPIPGDVNAQAFSSGWKDGEYWSGYRVVMKPLLLIADIRGIRLIQLIIVIVSVTWALIRVWRDIGCVEAAFLLVALLLINPINAVVNFDQAPDMIQALLSVVVVLWMIRKDASERWFWIAFLAFGMIEPFFNCLIMPLITLVLPLVACVLRFRKDGVPNRDQLVFAVKASLAWAGGYAFSFFSVWVLSALLKHESWTLAMIHGFQEFFNRAGSNEGSLLHSIFLSVQNNVNLNVPVVWLLIAAIAALWIIGRRDSERLPFAQFAAIFAVAAMPFIWILVLNNHSYNHSWMAHDIFAGTIWALLCCVYYIIRWRARLARFIRDGK